MLSSLRRAAFRRVPREEDGEMVLTRGAKLDPSNLLELESKVRMPAQRRLVVATVGPHTPALEGADWVRIDAARDTLLGAAAVRARHGRPALLDVPGPRTRREGTPLTTSEFLVHAAVEEYEWVNLRGVRHPGEVQRAREFLPASTRLTVTVSSARLLRHGSRGLAREADGLILGLTDLQKAAGPDRVLDLLRIGLLQAASQGRPCFAITGLLPSMLRRPRPTRRDLDRLDRLHALGCNGFILAQETLDGPHAQACIDVTRLVCAKNVPTPSDEVSRGGARVGGAVTSFDVDGDAEDSFDV